MVDREHEDLIQDVLDGVATREQAARLETFLGRDERVRERQAEMHEVFEALRRVPLAEFPADLRQRIVNALPARAAPRRPENAGAARWAASGFRVRYAYVFAAGLVAGIVTMGTVAGLWKLTGAGGVTTVTGSMMPWGAARRTWRAGPASLDATSWRVGTSRFAVLRVGGEGDIGIELESEPAGLAPVAVRRAPRGEGRVLIEPGRVLIQGADPGEYVVEFLELKGANPPLRVTIRAGGTTSTGQLPAQEPPSAGR